jgi:hypothetical protein
MHERAEPRRYVLSLWPNRLYAVPVALFTLLWLRFLWRWYTLLLIGGHCAPQHESRGFFVLFGMPFLMAGLSLVGTSTRLCFGRTVIALDGLRLRVRHGLFRRRLPFGDPLTLPTVAIRDFVAETSVRTNGELDEDRELDAWQVTVRLHDGCSAVLPLPVRTLAEADEVVCRLTRALAQVRAPGGYRDEVGTPSSDGSTSPLGASTT